MPRLCKLLQQPGASAAALQLPSATYHRPHPGSLTRCTRYGRPLWAGGALAVRPCLLSSPIRQRNRFTSRADGLGLGSSPIGLCCSSVNRSVDSSPHLNARCQPAETCTGSPVSRPRVPRCRWHSNLRLGAPVRRDAAVHSTRCGRPCAAAARPRLDRVSRAGGRHVQRREARSRATGRRLEARLAAATPGWQCGCNWSRLWAGGCAAQAHRVGSAVAGGSCCLCVQYFDQGI